MEKKLIRKLVNVVETKAADGEDRSLIVKISSINQDRSGDIVRPSGVVLDNYLKNPVVAAFHNYYQPAIGVASDLTITEEGITAKVTFPKAGTYELADILFELYKQGIQRGWSIGFMPIEWIENKDRGYEFTKWELLEFSAVVVPDNQDALTIMRSKGINNVDHFEKMINVKDAKEAPKALTLKELFPDLIKDKKEDPKEGDACTMPDGTDGTMGMNDSNELVCMPKKKKDAINNIEILSKENKIILHFSDGSKKEFTGEEVLMKFLKNLFDSEIKEGRVLSEKNRGLISSAVTQMEEAIKALKDLMDATESGKGLEKEKELIGLNSDNFNKFIIALRSELRKTDKNVGLSLQTINKLFNIKNSEQSKK